MMVDFQGFLKGNPPPNLQKFTTFPWNRIPCGLNGFGCFGFGILSGVFLRKIFTNVLKNWKGLSSFQPSFFEGQTVKLFCFQGIFYVSIFFWSHAIWRYVAAEFEDQGIHGNARFQVLFFGEEGLLRIPKHLKKDEALDILWVKISTCFLGEEI